MRTLKRILVVSFVCVLVSVPITSESASEQKTDTLRCAPIGCVLGENGGRLRCAGRSYAKIFGEAAQDIFYSHLHLISWDSFKVIATVFPFFISARMIDEKLQDGFHDRSCHRNINQMPEWCETVAKYGVGFPIAFFALKGFCDKDEEWRRACRAYVALMPFVIFGKDILKKLRFDACLRPWNEKFDCTKRASGGFPSGHMAEASFTAVLFGMRFGWRLALPLGGIAVIVGVTFLNCNRHYLSQLVAGAGFGAMYAVAVNKVVDARMNDDLSFGFGRGSRGEPAISCSYRF